jgi:subtilisin-like proprotein convertase family protein
MNRSTHRSVVPWLVAVAAASPAPAPAASYRVYPVPVEAPTFTSPAPPADARALLVDPAGTASPFGWHDVDGVAGAEFTVMRGNNVHAYDDLDANNLPPAVEPDCGAPLACDFPIDLTQPPGAWVPASVANLFYWNNAIHDITALYGFDSVGGNFQVHTYGLGGLGGDDVRAEAQEGIGTNGGNFATPPDGQRPRMQMFVWSFTTPHRDGSLDAGVTTHEYGHGISARLVGGPANVSCLSNIEAPHEGLSDVYALLLTSPGANPPVRGIATYLIGQPPGGAGIRSQRFDKLPEPNSNPWTYASIAGAANAHAVGEKWAQFVWYLAGRLEDAHGFDPDLYSFTGTNADAGNVRALYYTIEGLKNAVCSPGFVDVRNGMLAAAATAYGGADVCLLWEAFAEIGLGFSASQGSPNSVNDQVPAFDLPLSCSLGNAGEDARICAGTDHVQDVLVGPAFTAPVTMSASGNPAPTTIGWSENPVSGPLPETVQLTIGATATAPAGTSTITVTGDDAPNPPQVVGTFDLTIDAAAPAATTLLSPVNSSTTGTSPTFSWSAVASAIEYHLEVDDDPAFGSPEIDETVTGTSLPAPAPLAEDSLYYWRVAALNACGDTASAVFRFATSGPVQFCRTPSLVIPDNNTAGADDSMVITEGGVISDLDVYVRADHTWVGDLQFRLNNGGAPVSIFDRPGVPASTFGCSGDHVDVSVDDEGPDGSIEATCLAGAPTIAGDRVGGDPPSTSLLAGFDGQLLAGTWTLTSSDHVSGETGTLLEWCLVVPDSMPFLDGFETGDTTRWSAATP